MFSSKINSLTSVKLNILCMVVFLAMQILLFTAQNQSLLRIKNVNVSTISNLSSAIMHNNFHLGNSVISELSNYSQLEKLSCLTGLRLAEPINIGAQSFPTEFSDSS